MPDSSSSSTPYLPPEIIEHILSLLPLGKDSVRTLVACTLISKSFSAISKSNLLWAPQGHWNTDSTPRPPETQAGGAAAYHALRETKDLEALRCLRQLAKSTHNMLPLVTKVTELGLDVYDVLKEFVDEGNDAEEPISMKYGARELLGVILRRNAVETWAGIADGTCGNHPDTLLNALGALPTNPCLYFARYLDFIVGRELVPRLRNIVPADINKTVACVVSHLHALRLMPAFWSTRLFLDTIQFELIDTLRPGDFDANLAATPSIFAVAIFCAIIARLPPEFDIQAYAAFDTDWKPLACFAKASANVRDGGWCFSTLMEPLRVLPRNAGIDRHRAGERISRRQRTKQSFLPASFKDLVLCHFAKLASFVGVEDFGSAADDFVHIPYRAAQALLVLGDGPSWLHLPRIDMASFYRALEWSFRFDCSLIESVFLARQPDPKFQKKGGQLVARLRAKDGRPVVARRRSEAPRKVEFRVGDVFSWHKVEGVVAIVGWEWITLKHKWRLFYTLIDSESRTHKVPVGEMKATLTRTFPPAFFEELLEAKKLGFFFSRRDGNSLVPNARLAAQYPED